MLSPQRLELLRDGWRQGRRLGVLLPRGWRFPGRNPLEPLSTRQLNRAVHAAAEAAGIKKRVSPHTRVPSLSGRFLVAADYVVMTAFTILRQLGRRIRPIPAALDKGVSKESAANLTSSIRAPKILPGGGEARTWDCPVTG